MKIILIMLSALFLSTAPPSIAQDKVCDKVTSLDKLVTSSGEDLFLTSKSTGESDDFKINVYVNQREKRFTITKTYAKRNLACIIMQGYDMQLKRGSDSKDVKDEPNE